MTERHSRVSLGVPKHWPVAHATIESSALLRVVCARSGPSTSAGFSIGIVTPFNIVFKVSIESLPYGPLLLDRLRLKHTSAGIGQDYCFCYAH